MAGEINKEHKWDDISKVEAQSESHLEDDPGQGGVAIIRMFEFAANPEAFKQHTPTRQEIFNYHHTQIEAILWGDGMKILDTVNPTVTISKNGKKYRIFVGAVPQKGHILQEKPQTLSQIVHKK